MGCLQNDFSELKLFAGSASPKLGAEVAGLLGVPLGKAKIGKFADGENYVDLLESVRGKDVFVIQSTNAPVNANYMQLFLMLDALKRASSHKLSAIIPYYGYSRQDRLVGRSPLTASLIAHFIQEAGADAFMSVDLHTATIQGFFGIPTDNLSPTSLFAEYFKKKGLAGEGVVVVSPDVGGVKRARNLARKLDAGLAVIDKHRPKANESQVAHVVGEVKGKVCLINDDIADTGGSLVNAAEALSEKGAKQVFAAITHGVLSGGSQKKISESQALEELVITNSIEHSSLESKIRQVSLAPSIAEAIKCIYFHKSLSETLELGTSPNV